MKHPTIPLLLCLVISACSGNAYVPYDQPTETAIFDQTRIVGFEIADAFWRDPPDCAVVLPVREGGHDPALTKAIEASVARHLTGRLDRVIGPAERARLARDLAVDLDHPKDREAFARQTRCGFVAEVQPWDNDSLYAVLWSRTRMGLDVSVRRAKADSPLLWRARHAASRSDGGMALSPLSAVASVFQATSHYADDDIPYSLLDDVMRRIMVTFPDTSAAR